MKELINNFCNPSNGSKSTCLSLNSLILLINTYNEYSNDKNKIKYNKKDNELKLFNKLDKKLKKLTNGSGKYWFWTDIIEKMANDFNTKLQIKYIAKNELRPLKPKEWIKNPSEWLSNHDIDSILNQYNIAKYNYLYLGTYSIDFAKKNPNGSCLYSSICNINIKNYLNKYKYIGFVTNLDEHDEPGSHWTSTFIIIDPSKKAYGAYYYDSVGRVIPNEIKIFLNDIKLQCDKINPNKKFKIKYSTENHQRKNNECGMFSIIYQIRWLNINYNNNIVFKDIIKTKKLFDKSANNARNAIFRPNLCEIKKV